MPLLLAERFEEISSREWGDVLSRSRRPSPFLSRDFLVPWAKAFAPGRPLRLLRWNRSVDAGGFLFLYLRGDGQGWELVGGEQVADSLDALVSAGAEEPFWAEIVESMKELAPRAPVRLPNLLEGSPALALLPSICRERRVACLLEETDRSPYVSLPESFPRYLEMLGKKERHELRRKIRRAGEAEPGLAFRIAGTEEELARDFPSFVSLHRKSHPEKERFMDDRMAAFFREVADNFFSSGRLRLAFLRGASGDAATAFQVEFGGAMHLYNSGFDPAASSRPFSPGIVLLARCIEDAIRRGLREYDFLRGTERYKYDLGGRDRAVYRATLILP